MKIEKELTIHNRIESVWNVMGNQFSNIDEWASLICKSELSGNATEVGAIRTTLSLKGRSQQKLTAYDPDNHTMSYAAIKGAPLFLKNINVNWSLSELDANHTKLSLDLTYDTKGFLGRILHPLQQSRLSKIGDELLEDFKYFAETGVPSGKKKTMMDNSPM